MTTIITTQEQARQYAINWQASQSKKSISWLELVEEIAYLSYLADKFDLIDEFTENGIF
jgi:hypothetical protein